MARLDILAETNDGFEVAEEDLQLRRSGELAGTAQAGGADGLIGNIVDDFALYMQAKAEADAIVLRDPELSDAEHLALRALIDETAVARALLVTAMQIAVGFDFDHTLGVDNGLERKACVRLAAELGIPIDLVDRWPRASSTTA